jgi:hypothetical protein
MRAIALEQSNRLFLGKAYSVASHLCQDVSRRRQDCSGLCSTDDKSISAHRPRLAENHSASVFPSAFSLAAAASCAISQFAPAVGVLLYACGRARNRQRRIPAPCPRRHPSSDPYNRLEIRIVRRQGASLKCNAAKAQYRCLIYLPSGTIFDAGQWDGCALRLVLMETAPSTGFTSAL